MIPRLGRHFTFLACCALPLAIAAGCAHLPAAPHVLSAASAADIQSAMAPEVTIRGEVQDVDDGSVLSIHFKGAEQTKFSAVVLGGNREALDAGFGGSVAKAVTGKTIRVTGRMAEYRGNPQIVLTKPEQLVIE